MLSCGGAKNALCNSSRIVGRLKECRQLECHQCDVSSKEQDREVAENVVVSPGSLVEQEEKRAVLREGEDVTMEATPST